MAHAAAAITKEIPTIIGGLIFMETYPPSLSWRFE
jgi:hypothetical protein